MARSSVAITLGQALPGGQYNARTGASGPVSVDVATAVADLATLTTNVATVTGTLTTNVAAAVAVLVADGASPTQAHVNTLNTAWGLLATAIAALSTAAVSADLTLVSADDAADLVVDFNTSTVSSLNAVKAAMLAVERLLLGSTTVTQ